jgi:coenzyme PQQ precursor peptide PqqA
LIAVIVCLLVRFLALRFRETVVRATDLSRPSVQLAANGVIYWCKHKEENMAWNTPTLVEICVGLEINGYLPAEF